MGQQAVVWQYLTTETVGFVILFFLLVGSFLLMTLIFQAGCSLANVEPPGFLYSMVIVLITLVFTVPLNWGLARLVVGTVLLQKMGAAYLAVFLFIIGFFLCVLISTVQYVLMLRTSLYKGFLTGFFQQLLGLLAFSLLYGIFSVILALLQIWHVQL